MQNMGSEYINQKVGECLAVLIGEENEENLRRLKYAALKARQGIQPISRPLLGKETARSLQTLETSEDFNELKEHLIEYIIHSQRDEGERMVQERQALKQT